MATSSIPIFFIGATGYLGGSILARLLIHPRANEFDITAIVRSSEKASGLQSQFGVKTVVGSISDLDKLEDLSAQSHIVFSCADSDNLDAIKAICRGLKKRRVTAGETPIFIHTSGTAVIIDDARGLHPTDIIYNDLNADQIESIPPTAFRRNVDLAIAEADKEGYLTSYIVIPSTIWGVPSTPLIDAGLQKTSSIQIPMLIKAALGMSQGGVVGKGVGQWGDVHIDDVADLYIVLLDAILANPGTVGHGREGYYFVENGEHTWYDISKEIAKALYDLGRGKSPEPTTFTSEELTKYFGSEMFGNFFGTNARCRANRGRALGWKPVKTTAEMLTGIRTEVERVIAES
ncbi:NAD(P)-dependent Metabolic Enzyme [Abortiporus biennis]